VVLFQRKKKLVLFNKNVLFYLIKNALFFLKKVLFKCFCYAEPMLYLFIINFKRKKNMHY